MIIIRPFGPAVKGRPLSASEECFWSAPQRENRAFDPLLTGY
jgi:hypothetical protein